VRPALVRSGPLVDVQATRPRSNPSSIRPGRAPDGTGATAGDPRFAISYPPGALMLRTGDRVAGGMVADCPGRRVVATDAAWSRGAGPPPCPTTRAGNERPGASRDPRVTYPNVPMRQLVGWH